MSHTTHDRPSERLVGFIALLSAAVAGAVFPIAAMLRLRYPYEIEWLESELLQHTVRAMMGESLYAAPSATFSPTIYPPMFAWVAGLMASIVGPTLLAPRLVSTLATVGCALLVAAIARRLTGSAKAALYGAALVFAAYVPTGTALDLARVDALWVLELVAASAVAIAATRPTGIAVAGLLFAVATATKQPSVLFAVAMLAVILYRSRVHAAIFAVVWLSASGLFYLALHLATDGWSTTYLLWIPLAVPQKPAQAVYFLRDDLLRNFAPSVAIVLMWAVTRRADRPGGSLPLGWWAAAAAAGGATTAMRTLQGGALNTLLPLFVFGAIIVAMISGRILRHGSAATQTALQVALFVQFSMLTYNPINLAPTATDLERSAALTRRIQSEPGDVWIPSHTSYAYFAGKGFWVHRDPLLDLQYSGWNAFPDDLETKLRNGGFEVVIIDGPFVEARLQSALEHGYVLREELVDPPEATVGYRTQPRFLYRPSDRAGEEPSSLPD